MPDPSPKAHLYRLGIILVVFVVAFLAAKEWATPDSWDYDVWYRADSLKDIEAQPLAYGGNKSCKECHKETYRLIKKKRHRALSCESCHGALADHVRDNKKIAPAKVDKTRWQCSNCHQEQINRPKGFPQFSKDGKIGKFVRKHQDLDETIPCLKCHEAHDPKI